MKLQEEEREQETIPYLLISSNPSKNPYNNNLLQTN
jgi:hypothetical protein